MAEETLRLRSTTRVASAMAAAAFSPRALRSLTVACPPVVGPHGRESRSTAWSPSDWRGKVATPPPCASDCRRLAEWELYDHGVRRCSRSVLVLVAKVLGGPGLLAIDAAGDGTRFGITDTTPSSERLASASPGVYHRHVWIVAPPSRRVTTAYNCFPGARLLSYSRVLAVRRSLASWCRASFAFFSAAYSLGALGEARRRRTRPRPS